MKRPPIQTPWVFLNHATIATLITLAVAGIKPNLIAWTFELSKILKGIENK